MTGLRDPASIVAAPLLARLRSLSARSRLTAIAMLLLAAALFEPHWNMAREAYDFVAVIDITQSMNVLDYEIGGKSVSRLAYTKQVLGEALPELPCGSRVGWSIFTEYRVLLLVAPVEVCDNYHELLASLERIDGRMAWANASEVAKGVFWSLRTAKELGSGHGIVFFTDGHESPPLNPRFRPTLDTRSAKDDRSLERSTSRHKPALNGQPPEVRGIIVGVGGDALKPIPKLDPEGNSLGVWQADEVMQTDAISAGRIGSAAGERLVDETGKPVEAIKPSMTEHLSSLRGAYLAGLAQELQLDYHRLVDAPRLLEALASSNLAHPVPYRADLRVLLACLALVLLAATHLPGLGDPAFRAAGRRSVSSRT